LVERESFLLELCRYVVLNPVRAGQVKSPGEYRWSSYLATAGRIKKGPSFLTIDWVLSQFGEAEAEAKKGSKNLLRREFPPHLHGRKRLPQTFWGSVPLLRN
jgi:putative transposase